MKNYKQLIEMQRYQIEALNKVQKNRKRSLSIGVSASTICRELKRNTGLRGYRPKQAHSLALARKKEAVKLHSKVTHYLHR